MACQCGSAAGLDAGELTTQDGCGCDTNSGCDCGTTAKSSREVSLERVVMDLDMRVRRLEGLKVEATH